MATTKSSAFAQPSTPDLEHVSAIAARVLRGQELYREHAGSISFDGEAGVWYVPSQHDATSIYEVVLGRRGEMCECRDFEFHGDSEACKHIVAATIARAKTAPCSGCGTRHKHRDLMEVPEDHLTFFEGDKLCEGCAADHGGL